MDFNSNTLATPQRPPPRGGAYDLDISWPAGSASPKSPSPAPAATKTSQYDLDISWPHGSAAPQPAAGAAQDDLDISWPTGPGGTQPAGGGLIKTTLPGFELPSTSTTQFPEQLPGPLEWTQHYQQAITDAAKAWNVPADLILTILGKEGSGGNVNARGSSGELGIAQIMPGTAEGLKWLKGPGYDYRNNGILSIWAMAQLLSGSLDKPGFGRNPQGYAKAVAAYNENEAYAAAGEYWPTTLGYLAKAQQIANTLAPKPQEEVGYHINSAHVSDNHPKFPYPSGKPLPPEAAGGLNLWGAMSLLQFVNQTLDGIGAGSIKYFYGLASGAYDTVVNDLLNRTSMGGNKFHLEMLQKKGIFPALTDAVHTVFHGESQAEYDSNVHEAEMLDYQRILESAERNLGRKPSKQELENYTLASEMYAPTLVSRAQRGEDISQYEDPSKMSQFNHTVLDTTYKIVYDPSTYVGSAAVKGILRGVQALGRAAMIIRLGPKTIEQLGMHPEVITQGGMSAGEMLQKLFGDVSAVFSGAPKYKEWAALLRKKAPKIARLADKAADFEAEAAKVAKTDPKRAARLTRQAERIRAALQTAFRSNEINSRLGIWNQLANGFIGVFSSRWKGQIGLAKLGLLKNFNWLEPFGEGKRALAMSRAGMNQLVSWGVDQVSTALKGLDLKSKEARELFEALNSGKKILDNPVLNGRLQAIREVFDSIAWLYRDEHLEKALLNSGFKLPEVLKNLDRGQTGIMTTRGAVEEAAKNPDIDPKVLSALQKRGIYRSGYLPFRHFPDYVALTAEEAESRFLNEYQAITGIVVNTKDALKEVKDFFLKDRPNLSVYKDLERHVAQMHARIKIAASKLASLHLNEDATNIAKKFGFSPNDEAWRSIFSEGLNVRLAVKHLTGSDAAGNLLQTAARGVQKVTSLPLAHLFAVPFGHMSNMALLAIANRPHLIPRIVQLYVMQLWADARTGASRLFGWSKLVEGRYSSPGLRKFTDLYVSMGRYNGVKDWLTPPERSLAKTFADAAKAIETKVSQMGLPLGKLVSSPFRALSVLYNASASMLWPLDEAVKSALMEEYVEHLKLPIGRAFARTMAEFIDYSDPSAFASATRLTGYFSTWKTKLPLAVARLFLQNPALFTTMAKVAPAMLGQEYTHNQQEKEAITPYIGAFRDPLGIDISTTPLGRQILRLASGPLRANITFPESGKEDFYEQLGFPPELAKALSKNELSPESSGPPETIGQSIVDYFRQGALKEYPAPSGFVQINLQNKLLENELGVSNIHIRGGIRSRP